MRFSSNTLFAAGATVVVCAAVVGGLVLNGSPSQVRLHRLDEQKLNDLRSIARGVESFYASQDELPGSLQAILGPYELVDRDTGEEYEYRRTGEVTYELCATFHLALDNHDDRRWSHAAGHQCFRLDATSPRTNPCSIRGY